MKYLIILSLFINTLIGLASEGLYILPNSKNAIHVDYYTANLIVKIGASEKQPWWAIDRPSKTDVIFLDDGSVWKTKKDVVGAYGHYDSNIGDVVVVRVSSNKQYPFYLENVHTGKRALAKIWTKEIENLKYVVKEILFSEEDAFVLLHDGVSNDDTIWNVQDKIMLQNLTAGDEVIIGSGESSLLENPEYLLIKENLILEIKPVE